MALTRPVALLAIIGVSVPCSAFLPQGNLRSSSQPPAAALRWSAEAQDDPIAMQQLAGTTAAGCSALFGLTMAGAAMAALRASRRSLRAASRVECRVAGICFPVTDKFDPLELGSTDAKMERYTAVEIKHGRVAMIACVGYALPEFVKFPGCEKFENGLGAFSTLPVEGWVQLIAFIGAHEVLVKPRAGGMGSYDLGLGTELLEDIPDEELERRQTVERNNGRLAMIAIWGLTLQDFMFGKTPVALLKSDGWWGPSVDWFIKDIPICQIGSQWCAVKPAPRGPGITAMASSQQRVARAQGVTAMRSDLYNDAIWDKGSSRTQNVKVLLGEEEMKKSPALPFLDYPEQLEGWVGGEKGFDPLGISYIFPTYYMRECELKHGRVCMLATLGWIATDLGARFPGEMFQNVSTIEAHNKMVDLGQMQPFLATVGVCEIYGGWLWKNGQAGYIKRDAGDFFLGKSFLPKDEDKATEMRLKELENGRLAMLAFGGICTQAVLFGKTFPFA